MGNGQNGLEIRPAAVSWESEREKESKRFPIAIPTNRLDHFIEQLR